MKTVSHVWVIESKAPKKETWTPLFSEATRALARQYASEERSYAYSLSGPTRFRVRKYVAAT